MRRIAIAVISAGLLLPAAAITAQPIGGPMMGRGMMGGSFSPRRPYVRQHGLPQAYRNLTNPLPATEANITAGKQLFAARCAVCHGSGGKGDGPAAAQLNPAPTNLNFAVRTPVATDGYLYWSIAEGGVPIGSAMPAFKSSMSQDDIWQVIHYLRMQ